MRTFTIIAFFISIFATSVSAQTPEMTSEEALRQAQIERQTAEEEVARLEAEARAAQLEAARLARIAASEPNLKYYTDERQAIVLTSDFIVPMIRYDMFQERKGVNPKGKVSAFNSIGAGINIAFGHLSTKFQDAAKTKVDEKESADFRNYIALQGGILFSITSDENSPNIFAPCIGLSILDLSFMWGYDAAHSDEKLDGHFFTVAYNVPLRKIVSKALLPLYRIKKDKNEDRKNIPLKGKAVF